MSAPPPCLLLLEADRERADGLAGHLLADGYRVDAARNLAHARALAREHPPELALLGAPAEPNETLDALREIRAGGEDSVWDASLPALVLGARGGELDLLRAFEAGADDYLAPDGSALELRARVRALLRREHARLRRDRCLAVGPLLIDPLARSVLLDGRPLVLRRLEYELLLHLARSPNRVHPREELLTRVWAYGRGCSTRTVDTHASRLRRQLDPERTGDWVIGVRGVGYRLRRS